MLQANPADLSCLVEEYASLVPESGNPNWEVIEAKLIDVHEWTPEAASSLVNIAKKSGWFFLRNAAALAIACDIEDGQLNL